MKNRLIYLIIVVFAFSIAGCEPIEDRDSLSNSFDANAIDVSVIQDPPGTNKFILKMNTEGVAGYWDFIKSTKFTDEVEVIFPLTGTYTFSFNPTSPYLTDGSLKNVDYNVSKTIDVTIDKLDFPLPEEYYTLAGTTLDGKTWVFAGTPFDNTLWWYMAAPYNWAETWWNAAGECCPPADINGVQDATAEINFTVLQDYTYELDGVKTEGIKWEFSDDLKILKISDPTKIPGYRNEWGEPRANKDGWYEVIELTDDRLVLYTNETIQGGTGWIWVFVPKTN